MRLLPGLIQQEIFSAGLVVDMQVLGSLYDAIRPSMPNRSHPEEVIRFNNELSLLQPEIDENTPVAEVGRPTLHRRSVPVSHAGYTGRLDCNRLPPCPSKSPSVIPSWPIGRSAYDQTTTAAMRLNRKVAEYTALYYSTLQQTVDTLGEVSQTEPLAERYYEAVEKTNNSLDYQTTSYTLYTFADSLTAVRAL